MPVQEFNHFLKIKKANSRGLNPFEIAFKKGKKENFNLVFVSCSEAQDVQVQSLRQDVASFDCQRLASLGSSHS